MANKRKITDEELEAYANMSDDEWNELFGSDSEDDYNPTDVSSDDSNDEENCEDEVCVQPNTSTFTIWENSAQEPPQFNFVETMGFKIDTANFSIIKLVELFFSNDFLTLLVEQTNLYALQNIEQRRVQIKKSQRISNWKATDIPEMKLFLGLLLHMGSCNLPSIEHYWSTNHLYNFPFWRSKMSRNRFQLLLHYLHFTDNSEAANDKLHKLRPVLDHFNSVMRNSYTPNRNLRIDESMVLWRGRQSFRQYIKNKKHKYCVKLYELCELNGLVIKIEIYTGKSESSLAKMGHASDIVFHLMEEYLDRGYVLHMDNFYNSVVLTESLTDRKTYVCGTLRNNRKNNPPDVIQKKLKKGEFVWQRRGPVLVSKWKDKREILSISNMHKFEMVEAKNRNGKIQLKPNIVRDYNLGMSGIDLSDQMLSYYSALRKTVRWPKKLAIRIFDIYIQNAHKFYNIVTGNAMTALKFRDKFISVFVGMDEPITSRNINRIRDPHYLEILPPTEKKNRPTKPCRVCTRNKQRRETRYYCPVCQEKPPLCVENCFKVYHS